MKQLRSYHAGLVKDNNANVHLYAVDIYECIMLFSRFLHVFLFEASSQQEHLSVFLLLLQALPYLQYFY